MIDKKLVGEKAVDFVKDGMVVGLGTGSTVYYTIIKLGELVKEGLSIIGIPTSIQTEELAKKVGIPIGDFKEIEQIDVAIDGADEVDSNLNLIKGGGGALLREKIIAKAAKAFIVVATPPKMVEKLGAFKLPVEVVPFGTELTEKHICELGGEPLLRQSEGIPFMTDNGNYIFDCIFLDISNPKKLEEHLNIIPGVVENGLFVGMSDTVITLDRNKNVLFIER
ncbi:ribose-5-phosphate isomerase RpiA [Metabacillus sediminilitoris]|uniref:Ribose-5-phosphate isomerase A n=1 Tax=Metabacillus sediminilitoris TaxID=2567941 RepID=A0A4S4C9F7_9BACI|nr:ribose-5-phosphate isomerase RpiA [Metabacillus sediminilitoris]QGQ45255.1 ribose-5-phosphate isomerase RpiA [Metabacillus sediminilitoris]THF82446.1 ribose-5-phosphate isomerase RpiA [Metabacillus sediminilitoris]